MAFGFPIPSPWPGAVETAGLLEPRPRLFDPLLELSLARQTESVQERPGV
jgi:hypothetical protein